MRLFWLKINVSDSGIGLIGGSDMANNDPYYQKYMKYKAKYMKLRLDNV